MVGRVLVLPHRDVLMTRVRLIDAIEANKNGLASLVNERNRLADEGRRLLDKADCLTREIQARKQMADAMQRVQDIYPKDETLSFNVPEVRD